MILSGTEAKFIYIFFFGFYATWSYSLLTVKKFGSMNTTSNGYIDYPKNIGKDIF